MKTIFKILFFLPLSLHALSIDEILRADKSSIKLYIKEQKRRHFSESVCKKQKERGRLATACFEHHSLKSKETWREDLCLSASPIGLNLKILKELLQEKKSISPACRRHLRSLKKILLYRKKDFLLPELKKYWTEQKLLP